MQVVWMVRMEKQTEAGQLLNGLLSAGEEEGKWMILWEPDDASGSEYADHAGQSHGEGAAVWYEGQVWSEMRAALRCGVARLLRDGYQPALGFMPDTNLHERRMKERNEWISCYGDLHPNEALYERLAQWRRETASSLRRAPYWIATNRMLRLVSAFVPHNAEELRQLPGFGEAKVRSYADAIIAITGSCGRSTSFPLDWVEQAVPEADFIQWIYAQEQMKMDAELTRLTQRRLLLEGVRDSLKAPELMELLQIDRRELLVRIEALSSDGYDMLPFIQTELANVPEEELGSIRSALTELGGEYLKPVFVHVYEEEALEEPGADVTKRYEYIRFVRMTMEQDDKRNASRKQSA